MGVPQLVSGTLYGPETNDPLLLLSQLLQLMSCFYMLLSLFSLGALTLLRHRQLSSHLEQQPDLLLLEGQQLQQQKPDAAAFLHQKESAAALVTAAAGVSGGLPPARRLSLLFSSGSSETPKETAAALDAALLLTGAALSVFVYWVVRRSRKVPDFCVSLGLLHLLACCLLSGFPPRYGFWVALLSSGCLCGSVAFCLCRRAECQPLIFRVSTSNIGGPLDVSPTAEIVATEMETLNVLPKHQENQQLQQV